MRNFYLKVLLIISERASLAVKLLRDRKVLKFCESSLIKNLVLCLFKFLILEVESLADHKGFLSVAVLSK
jgi:hypothetical protein